MAAQGYEFYLRVLKVSLTSERSERVRDTDEIPTQNTTFFNSFLKQQNSAIKVVTYRKMPVTKML